MSCRACPPCPHTLRERGTGAAERLAGISGHPDPATALQERRARYVEAICVGPGRNLAVDRVLEVADSELADLKAEFERLRAEPSGKVKCSCNTGPGTEGPVQDCPEHGDVRWYAAWFEQAMAELKDARATIAEVRALHRPGTTSSSRHWCQHCGHIWPCPTLTALDAPGLERERDAPTVNQELTVADGSGTWLSGWDHSGPSGHIGAHRKGPTSCEMCSRYGCDPKHHEPMEES